MSYDHDKKPTVTIHGNTFRSSDGFAGALPEVDPRDGIHGVIAFYAERCPTHLEPKPYRATLCYAASSSPCPGGEIARVFEAAEALSRGRDEAGPVWFDWDGIYQQAKRGGLDAVLALAGGDRWGFGS